MRVYEIITEAMQDDVARALPATFAIPKLQNQDAYHQYRFGMALAAARGAAKRQEEIDHMNMAESPWGENQIVVTYDETDAQFIDDALQSIGMSSSDKKLISTPKSQEPKKINTTSPVAKPKRNKYGV